MNDNFIIPLNGLTAGEKAFSWKAGKEFFESFENSEIIDAELVANAVIKKSGSYLGVDCSVEGSVTVECDRCLEDLDMPIDTTIMLSVKYGEEETPEEHQEGEREVIFIPQDDAELDLSQVIYDYVCLSLPMQRHHEEGECNPAAAKYLAGEALQVSEENNENNPFAALKGMF